MLRCSEPTPELMRELRLDNYFDNVPIAADRPHDKLNFTIDKDLCSHESFTCLLWFAHFSVVRPMFNRL